ncbi:MAG: SIS domain-containing protein [Ginsengibacter sp.]
MTGTSCMVKEISSQPELWLATYNAILSKKEQITSFMNGTCELANLQIILTGAGSSAFIGEILQFPFHKNTGIPVKAIATTDLVTHPENFFDKTTPTLIVHFARSGDSPESVATFELAEKFTDMLYHLVITCNRDGKLAKMASETANSFVFLLPEETNDQALAMTSSFTSMTLAGLLFSDISNIEENGANVKKMITLGEMILDKYSKELDTVADIDFKRIVFLGSGPLKGTAREAHLKVIELTDGKIICQYDSFLGFRHGPKAVIDESTLLVYFFSSDPYVYKYETDLVNSINRSEHFIYSIGIGQDSEKLDRLNLNLALNLCIDNDGMPDDYFSICSIIPVQILGFYKSLSLGLTPDSPSKNGGIHRIVQGVTIYPY